MLSAYATVSWAIDAALVYFDASRVTATLFLLAVWAVMVGPWYGAVVVAYHAAVRRLAPWTWPLVGGWLWAVGEWGRSTVGLPWCLLAHTQVEQSSLIQIADLGGAYAVTAVMVAVSIGGAQLLVDPRRPGARAGACVALGVLAAALAYGRMRLSTVITR